MNLPNGWTEQKIADVGEVITGGTPSTLDESYWDGELPWVTPTDISDERDILASERSITPLGLRAVRPIPAGSVLVTCIASIGKNAVLKVDGACNQQINAITPHAGYDANFLYYLLEHHKGFLLRMAGNTTTPIISKGVFKQLSFFFPPLGEQRAIAQLLARWDEALRDLAQLIEAKARLKRALMQQLLTGKRRFAPFDAPWKTYRLAELFAERCESNRTDLPLLSITADRGVIPREEVERKDTSNVDKKAYLRIAPGDIGYNTMRMWQGVSAVSRLEGLISPAYTVCIPNEKIEPDYAGYLFKSAPMVALFNRHSQGMVSDTLSLKFHHFARLSVSIPGRDEQQKIVETFQRLDREIQLLEAQRAALARQKRGLMARLLSGQTRLKPL